MNESNQKKAIQLAKDNIKDLLWKSANIEIRGVTFPDTAAIFDGFAPSGMPVDDIITINNLKRAWQFMLENAQYPISYQYVSEYNRLIGEGLFQDPGLVRTSSVTIGGTEYAPAVPTLDSVQADFAQIQEIDEALNQALTLFAHISRQQWFFNGNKRTSLICANHVLINSGIGVMAIKPQQLSEYYSQLLDYYETNHGAVFIQWLKDNTIQQIN
jgi:Fic family protein